MQIFTRHPCRSSRTNTLNTYIWMLWCNGYTLHWTAWDLASRRDHSGCLNDTCAARFKSVCGSNCKTLHPQTLALAGRRVQLSAKYYLAPTPKPSQLQCFRECGKPDNWRSVISQTNTSAAALQTSPSYRVSDSPWMRMFSHSWDTWILLTIKQLGVVCGL